MQSEKKLNILIIPEIFPFPPTDGGKICIYSFIDKIRFWHNITLLLPVTKETEEIEIKKVIKNWENVTIRYTVEYTNQRKSILQKGINWLRIFYHFVKQILSKSSRNNKNNNLDLNIGNFRTSLNYLYSQKFITEFNNLISETRFDIIQTEGAGTLSMVNYIPPYAKSIYVEIESQHSILNDIRNLNLGISNEYITYLTNNIKMQELSYISKYDAVFCLNEQDHKNLQNEFPDKQIFTSPFPILETDFNFDFPAVIKAEKIIFVGYETHKPNRDGLLWFVNEILPFISLGNTLIYVTSTWSKETREIITSKNKNIVFTGFVDDLGKLLENSISIVPIRLGGGGIRTKTIYSMASNAAVVTTSIAAVGIPGAEDGAYIIEDNPQDFANAITRLLEDQKLYSQTIIKGKKFVQDFFDQTALSKKRCSFYSEIIEKEN